MLCCPQCRSEKTWKDGFRQSINGSIQRYICRDCGYRFSENNLPKSFYLPLNTGSFSQIGATPKAHGQIVKNLAEVKPFKEGPAGATKLRSDDKGKVIEFSFWMLKQGYSQATIKGRTKRLYRLLKLGANLADEDSVKTIIAQQKWSVSHKVNIVDTYDSFLKMQDKRWTPPIYKRVRKLPFIPTEIELDQLIAGCSKKIATYLQLLKETGIRSGEASMLEWIDIDFERRLVRITPEKGSDPRVLPTSVKLTNMLNEIPKNKATIFGVSSDTTRRNFAKQRKRIAAKLKNPRIKKITFHTFRHWKATMEYHKTRDILHVKQVLGHKSLNSTLLYTQLINFSDDEFKSAVAHSEDEACKLVEAGFEYVCSYNTNKIFRKRK
jgi:integrase